MKKKLFILGIGGLTGLKLCQLAKNDFELYGSFNLRDPQLDFVLSNRLDISNFDNLKEILNQIKPDLIINTIALSSVDYCEQHPDDATKLNVKFVSDLFSLTENLSIKTIHLSSDSVFDGTKILPYVETDPPNPINHYGKTKLLSEKIILQNNSNLIVRASVLYGWLPKNIANKESSSKKSHNFSQWLINQLQSNKQVKIITDERSSPIIAEDFASSILHLIKKDLYGVYHSAPPIDISRYDFSLKLANFLNFDSSLIVPVTNVELDRKVKTGQNKSLDSSKIQSTGFQFLTLNQSFELLKNQLNS